MRTRGAERAVVDDPKVRDYLLEHPVNRSKRFHRISGVRRERRPLRRRNLLEVARYDA